MRLCLTTIIVLSLASLAQAETVDELLAQAKKALAKGQSTEALALAGQAIALEPKNPSLYLFRGGIYEALQRHERASAEYDMVIRLDAKVAEAYDLRGSEQFKLGNVAESIKDFDKFLELKPAEKAGHWKRGISLYYVGRFEEGKKQFEGYEKVDVNDVENAVWHFLCNARLVGVEKARAALLKIGNDKRVPMMRVYELYAGKAKPADVLAAVTAGDPPAEQLSQRLFYAHLYLGLFAEAAGDKKLALEHLTLAGEKHKISHYMGDVARVHMEMLRKELKAK